ncbi:MAG: hypothetical protein WC829_06005 [Hyphomicrobium sp.]
MQAFTLLHVAISLVAIVAGLIALRGMLHNARPGAITHLFLITTALTTVTGFMFPITAFTPAIGVGIVSAVLLVAAFLGIYAFNLAGSWRWIYAATAIAALYLNCFVLIVQSFQKVPVLAQLAPTQSEPPFQIAQALLLMAFVWYGWRAVRRFHPMTAAPPEATSAFIP